MENERIHTGDIVQHFKRETLSPEDRNANKYLYKVLGVAVHSETREKYIVYQAFSAQNRCSSSGMVVSIVVC